MLYVCLRTVHIHTHRGKYTTLFTVYTSLLCTCIYTQKYLFLYLHAWKNLISENSIYILLSALITVWWDISYSQWKSIRYLIILCWFQLWFISYNHWSYYSDAVDQWYRIDRLLAQQVQLVLSPLSCYLYLYVEYGVCLCRGRSRLLKRGGTTRPVIIVDVGLVRYVHS